MDRESFVADARRLAAVFKERAAQTEALRQISSETLADLQASRLLLMHQPERYGGLGLDIDAVVVVAAELGRGCGSTAWCYANWSAHTWLIGMFEEQAQDEVWAGSPHVRALSCNNPARAHVTQVTGGYRLKGRWDFASGCDGCDWGIIAANGPGGPLFLLVPKTDFEIIDTWFAAGLRGTGSKDIVIEDAFVPAHRVMTVDAMREARTPGRTVHDGCPSWRVPLYSFWSFFILAPMLGMARGAIEAFETAARERPASKGIPALIDLAEASALVDAVDRIIQTHTRALLAEDAAPSMERRVLIRRDQTFANRLLVRAVNLVYGLAGAHGIYDSSPLPRFHRDVNAASHHAGIAWSPAAEQFGRFRLGMEPSTGRY
jgi:3-hydroxy-9,10-secoandrosta-1,3,5(10)-triene-9,17-dione monooxygenase